MTRFEEIQALVEKNKKRCKPAKSTEDDLLELEVHGITESSKGGNPHMEFATDETDPDLIDQLYRSNRNRVPRGEGASAWDSDY